ncbi:hypothetical protein SUZIE_115415 [Sciurus carolinensis]|uniref:Uncharacterized protein n=1 Tax=Sciurus carolinensis TaxID=30640 RepID=A0AA41SQC4_SCICA|nr:hypothetical protein [Sciurus carolinensis]
MGRSSSSLPGQAHPWYRGLDLESRREEEPGRKSLAKVEQEREVESQAGKDSKSEEDSEEDSEKEMEEKKTRQRKTTRRG